MEYENPFYKEEPMLIQIVLKHVLDKNATSPAKRAREIDLNQFDSFIDDLLRNGTASLYDNKAKNNLPLLFSEDTVVTSKSKKRIANLEADPRLYTNLFVACQARDGGFNQFFAHENHDYPVSRVDQDASYQHNQNSCKYSRDHGNPFGRSSLKQVGC